MTAEVIDARQRFMLKRICAACEGLTWAHVTLTGELVIETDEPDDNDEPPPEAA